MNGEREGRRARNAGALSQPTPAPERPPRLSPQIRHGALGSSSRQPSPLSSSLAGSPIVGGGMDLRSAEDADASTTTFMAVETSLYGSYEEPSYLHSSRPSDAVVENASRSRAKSGGSGHDEEMGGKARHTHRRHRSGGTTRYRHTADSAASAGFYGRNAPGTREAREAHDTVAYWGIVAHQPGAFIRHLAIHADNGRKVQMCSDLVEEMNEDERIRLLRYMVRACGIERSLNAVENARLDGEDSGFITSSDYTETETDVGEENAGNSVRIDFGTFGDSDEDSDNDSDASGNGNGNGNERSPLLAGTKDSAYKSKATRKVSSASDSIVDAGAMGAENDTSKKKKRRRSSMRSNRSSSLSREAGEGKVVNENGCSTFSATISVMKLVVGIGSYALPKAFSLVGLLGGLILTPLMALMCAWSISLLVTTKAKFSQSIGMNCNYNQLARSVPGLGKGAGGAGRLLGGIVNAAVVVASIGGCTSYIDFTTPLMTSIFGGSHLKVVLCTMPMFLGLAYIRDFRFLCFTCLLGEFSFVVGTNLHLLYNAALSRTPACVASASGCFGIRT